MRGTSREIRQRCLLLGITLLLALGLAAASPAHGAAHGAHSNEAGHQGGADHPDHPEGTDEQHGHACVACAFVAVEGPSLPVFVLRAPEPGRVLDATPRPRVEIAEREPHAPRGPPTV